MGPALMYYSGFVYVMQAPGKEGAIALALSLEPESMPEGVRGGGGEAPDDMMMTKMYVTVLESYYVLRGWWDGKIGLGGW